MVSTYLKNGMPEDPKEALVWYKQRVRSQKINDHLKGEWQDKWKDAYMIDEIKAHGRKSIYPDWSSIAANFVALKKNRETPIRRWAQFYRVYWLAWEINQHSRRSVFPDWGCLALQYMENKAKRGIPLSNERKKAAALQKKEYRRRDYVRKRARERRREMIHADPFLRLRYNIGRRLNDVMNGSKNSSVMEYVGCTAIQLRKHIELQFVRKMGWHNYGSHWHVDHILPCKSFDHTDAKQLAQCWHWTNLRPLEAQRNIAKADKITEPQMQLLLCVTH